MERVTIPYVEVQRPVDLVHRWPDRLNGLVRAAVRRHGRLGLAFGERLSRYWLANSCSPYRDEIAAVASHLGRPGATLLNLSYEWHCTTGVARDPAAVGNRMLRTLDWPMPGLGRTVVIARHEGAAGYYLNVTWPGFIGVLTAMAPGRFSAAINQPPQRRHSPLPPLDWLLNRRRVWRSVAMPPAHLLRHVFETCHTYAEAKRALTETPVCLPVFFTLSGVAAEQGCVIERLEARAWLHDGETAIANHFIAPDLPVRLRGRDSDARRKQMLRLVSAANHGFEWLVPPILNETTRIAVIANAALGSLQVQGWEDNLAVTRTWSLPAAETSPPGATDRAA